MNRRRWNGTKRGHYEVWYLTMADPPTGRGLWVRYTFCVPDEPGRPYECAALWCTFFRPDHPPVAIKETHPLSALSFPGEAHVEIAGHRLAADAARGAAESGGRRAAWDLRFTPNTKGYSPIPGLFRAFGLAKTVLVCPNPDLRVDGTLTLDGETIPLAGWRGNQAHLWGRRYGPGWLWGHVNAFPEEGASLEALSARVRVLGGLSPPLTTLLLRTSGQEVRMTGALAALGAVTEFVPWRWRILDESARWRLHVEFSAKTEQMAQVRYTGPQGERIHCANTEVGAARVLVEHRAFAAVPWRPVGELVCPVGAAFEVARSEPWEEIPLLVE